MPGILKGDNLCCGLLSAFLLKEDVISSVGIERRVEVNQVNTLRSYVLTQNVQVIPKVELVFPAGQCHIIHTISQVASAVNLPFHGI